MPRHRSGGISVLMWYLVALHCVVISAQIVICVSRLTNEISTRSSMMQCSPLFQLADRLALPAFPVQIHEEEGNSQRRYNKITQSLQRHVTEFFAGGKTAGA
jgi:hypothetical protein